MRMRIIIHDGDKTLQSFYLGNINDKEVEIETFYEDSGYFYEDVNIKFKDGQLAEVRKDNKVICKGAD